MRTVSNQVARRLESLHYPIFLYCTRTILRHRTPLKQIPEPATFSTAPATRKKNGKVSKNRSGKDERISFFKEKSKPSGGKDALSSKIRRYISPGNENTSTITVKERSVFKKIFNDIATGPGVGKRPEETSPQTHKMTSPIDYRQIFSIFSSAPSEDMSASDENAARRVSGVQQESTVGGRSNTNRTLSDQDKDHIQKYPQQLRKIASRATLLARTEFPDGVVDDGRLSQRALQSNYRVQDYAATETDLLAAETEFSEASAAQKSAIHSICTAQMERISEILMRAAKTNDKELWTACEMSVFPLLTHLGEAPPRSSKRATSRSSPAEDNTVSRQAEDQQDPDPTSKAATAESDKTNPFAKSLTTSRSQPEPLFHIPSDIPSLPIISTLYPALVLLIVRLLTTHYPLSHYNSILLPRLRGLGCRSYVLGTSTQLYNTLLVHRWDVYSDLRSMDTLLLEMKLSGIDFDAGTLQILERVRTEKMEDDLAERNAAEERKRQASMLPTMSKKQRKERERAKLVAMSKGERDDASAGKRAKSWWAAERTCEWLDRVVGAGGWRTLVMERLRDKRVGDGEDSAEQEVVEREYADGSSTAGSGGHEEGGEQREQEKGPNNQSVAVWL